MEPRCTREGGKALALVAAVQCQAAEPPGPLMQWQLVISGSRRGGNDRPAGTAWGMNCEVAWKRETAKRFHALATGNSRPSRARASGAHATIWRSTRTAPKEAPALTTRVTEGRTMAIVSSARGKKWEHPAWHGARVKPKSGEGERYGARFARSQEARSHSRARRPPCSISFGKGSDPSPPALQENASARARGLTLRPTCARSAPPGR
jgi:hypothetical protein